MKKLILLILLSVITLVSLAQTQQGIVKTRGRVVNGQVVPGTRLNGATITLNIGNPLVSGDDGAFSFNVPTGKNYSLVTAKKQGYTLADPEYIHRTFAYSASNPFYVVLEDEAQRQADINAATRKVRRTLTAQLQAREDEIEALKEQNKLTEEEYQKRLEELYDNQSKSEQLVKDMAERYASTDYDQLDEFNCQVQMLIEEGELQKADSMIRSKGDIEKRVAEYHNVVAANKKVREELELSEAGVAKTYEDLSQDLLNKHTIAMQQYRWDDALTYLKQRADLDTTNYYAVWNYAEFSLGQQKFYESLRYWSICLDLSDDIPSRLIIMHNMSNVFYQLHEYRKCAEFYKSILDIYDPLFEEDPDTYREYIVNPQMNLGITYNSLREYDNARVYLDLALKNLELLFSQDPEAYRESLAMSQNNMALLYSNINDFGNSERYYLKSLENYEVLCSQNPEKYRPGLARTQANLGLLYNNWNDYTRSLDYYKKAIESLEQLFQVNPDAYRVELANTQNSIGVLYKAMGNFEESKRYYSQSLENRMYMFSQYPGAYRGDLAIVLSNIGNLLKDSEKYAQAEKIYKFALEQFDTLVAAGQEAFRINLTNVQINFGDLYMLQSDYRNAIKYHESGWQNLKLLSGQSPAYYRADVATLLTKLSSSYAQIDDYDNYGKYLLLASDNFDSLIKERPESFNAFKDVFLSTHYGLAAMLAGSEMCQDALGTIDKTLLLFPKEPCLYELKGSIFLMLKKNDEALAMWRKVLELNPDFLKDYPDGTNLSNGLKQLGLIE